MTVMRDSSATLPGMVRTRVMRLNPIVVGIAAGVITGAGLMLATIVLLVKGGSVIGPHLSLINQVYVGFSVTWVGSLIGFAYAGATGFIAASCGAVIYNRISERRQKASCPR